MFRPMNAAVSRGFARHARVAESEAVGVRVRADAVGAD